MRLALVLPIGCILVLAGSVAAQQAAMVDAPFPQEDAGVQASASQQAGASGHGSAEQTEDEKARQQLKDEEHQRVLGVIPLFGTTYLSDAISLTPKQKMELAFRSSVDPATFAFAALVAGYHEANDDYPGYGWGAAGFGKRMGAAYLDAFDGTMIGGGILPSLLHQDPRYFRLGHGSKTHRALYAVASTVICKHDKSGRWEPNYSNVAGTVAAGAISNLYYPQEDSGVSQTVTSAVIVLAEGAAGSVFDEFWPDLSRRFLHKDPTHGLDAQAEAADRAAKARGKKKQELQPMSRPE